MTNSSAFWLTNLDPWNALANIFVFYVLEFMFIWWLIGAFLPSGAIKSSFLKLLIIRFTVNVLLALIWPTWFFSIFRFQYFIDMFSIFSLYYFACVFFVFSVLFLNKMSCCMTWLIIWATIIDLPKSSTSTPWERGQQVL